MSITDIMKLTRYQIYQLTQSLNFLEKETGLLKSSLIPLWQATFNKSRGSTITKNRNIDLRKPDALEQLKIYFGDSKV